MAKHLFDSRKKAREYAALHGGRIKDRGAFFAEKRWAVIGASEDSPSVVTTRVFLKSRGKARKFCEEVNGVLTDHAKGKGEYIKKDLEEKCLRWSVEYRDPAAATEADMAIYRGIAEGHPSHQKRDPEKCYPGENGVQGKEPIVVMTLNNICVTTEDGQQLVMTRSHEDFKVVVQLFMDGDLKAMIDVMSVEKKPREWTFGKDICVMGGKLYHYGMEVPQTVLARRIISDCESGQDPEKFVNFFRKMMLNPSYRAIRHIYEFVEHHDLEILDDGNIRAWKMITSAGYAYRGVPNFKGMTIQMPRNQVEDNPEVTCSYGLHVAAKEYFKHHFNGYMLVEVSVSPQDIVSVPTDYKRSKCRSCKYTILTGLPRPADVPEFLQIDKNGNRLKEIPEYDK